MPVDLERALTDWDYLESVWLESDPVTLLTRAGAYAHAHRETVDFTDWNGAVVGSGGGSVLRDPCPADPKLPFEELKVLLAHGGRGHTLVAAHPSTPVETLAELAKEQSYEVQVAVSKNPNSDEPVLRELCRSRIRTVREYVAMHPRITPAIVELILADEDDYVPQWLPKHPGLDASMLARVAEKRPSLTPEVAAHKNAGSELLLFLASSSSLAIRAVVAANANTPAEGIALIAKQELNGPIRAGLASHHATSRELVDYLMEFKELRAALARRDDLSPENQRRCLAEAATDDVLHMLAWHATDQGVIKQLLTARGEWTQQCLAKNPNCRLFEELAGHKYGSVREAIAKRLDAPRFILEELACDKVNYVAAAAKETLSKLP